VSKVVSKDSSKKTSRLVPVYGANGKRLRNRSMASVETLLEQGKIMLTYTKRGAIKAAQFLDGGGANPIRTTAHLGTQYSFHNRIRQDAPLFAWEHRPLVQPQDIEALFGETVESQLDRDLYVRAIFRAVPLSCMTGGQLAGETPQTPSPEAPAAAKRVLSIADFADRRRMIRAKREGLHRPVEFDSEMRAA
jgi:hypothetical protein